MGTAVRYAAGRSLWAVFAVNVVGSLVAGMLVRRAPSEPVRLFAVVGFLGGLTTMSAVAVGTDRLVADGDVVTAAVFLVGTVVCGIAAARLGSRR